MVWGIFLTLISESLQFHPLNQGSLLPAFIVNCLVKLCLPDWNHTKSQSAFVFHSSHWQRQSFLSYFFKLLLFLLENSVQIPTPSFKRVICFDFSFDSLFVINHLSGGHPFKNIPTDILTHYQLLLIILIFYTLLLFVTYTLDILICSSALKYNLSHHLSYPFCFYVPSSCS